MTEAHCERSSAISSLGHGDGAKLQLGGQRLDRVNTVTAIHRADHF